jgi:hypothetical protein
LVRVLSKRKLIGCVGHVSILSMRGDSEIVPEKLNME